MTIEKIFIPASLSDAAALKRDEGAIYFGGGTWINWAASGIRADKAVLLATLLDKGVIRSEDGVDIGAGMTLQEMADHPEVPEVLHRAARFIPSRCVRNMATLGGNIAANRPDSAVIPALIVLEARVETVERGTLSVEDYISRKEDALITRIRLPEIEGTCVVDRVARSSAAYPTLILAARVTEQTAIIALGCLADRVIRLRAVEQGILKGGLQPEEAIFEAVLSAVDPPAGLKESAAYRKYITATAVARAVVISKGKQG